MNMTSDASDYRSKTSWVALLILFGVWGLHCAVDLVIFKEAEVPPYYDAANHTNISMEIRDHLNEFEPSIGWFDKLYEISSYYPPCYHLFAAVCLKIRPHTLDSARLPNLFFLGLLMLSVYLLGNLLFDSKTGLLAGVLVSFFPVVHGLTREIYVDLAVLAWAAAGAYLVLASDGFGRKGIAFLFGVVCGFGLLTKWTFPVFIGFPVLWVFSGMFLPAAPGRLIGSFFSTDREEESGSGLYRAGLFVVGWVGVLYCFVSLFRGTGSFILLAILSLVFIGLLIGAVKQLSFSQGFARHWDEARRPTPPLTSSLVGIVIASIPALLIAGPWYVKHFGFIASEGSRVLTEAAQVRGMAEVQTLDSMLYYFLTLESHQLRLPFWLLAISALLTVLFGKTRKPSAWFLLGTFALSYAVMSSLWVKDPRYFTPAIYPLPILIAWWLLSRNPSTRPIWLTGTLAVALIGYANQVIGLPGLSKRVEIPTPLGQPLTLAGPAPYGDMLRLDADWPHRSMVEGIQAHRDHVSHIEGKIEVPVLVDDGYLHAPALNCYSKMLGANLDFFNIAYRPDYRADPGSTRRLLNVLRAPYFITKQGGDLGLDFVAKNYTPLLMKLFDEENGWGEGLKPLAVYHLPDGATSTLWKNQFPAALLGERVATDTKFSNGVRVTGYRFSKRDLYKKGEATLLQVDWVPEPVENLESMVAGTQFFLHLQDPRDGRFIQGWNFPLTEEGTKVANFQVRSGSPPAVMSTLLIEPRGDLLPGKYEWRLGLFKSDSLAKVAIADPVGKIETTMPLGDPFKFEPKGWEWINAEFEDRAALEARDEIGAVDLESARFDPPSVRPGESVELECHWAYEWLEMEAPEEQDVRGFAYLLPISTTTTQGSVARTGWILDAYGQSGEGMKRWSTETHIEIPSDLPEGPWRVCVGVERPQYEREFVLREGDQSGRNAYALSQPLLVGRTGWESVRGQYPQGLQIEAARIREASPTVGANIEFEIAWNPESATTLMNAASKDFLFVHLYSLEDQDYTQLESFPLFRKERIEQDNPRVGSRTGRFFFQGIADGFTEVYPIRLKEDLPQGPHRVDFGLFDPTANRKEAALLPSGATTTTILLDRTLSIRPLR